MEKLLKDGSIIDHTKSVCPICLKVLPAEIFVQEKAVYMKKSCPEHGDYTSYLWPDIEHYMWMRDFKIPAIPPHSPTPIKDGCPSDCGLCQAHLRHPTL
ncbi:MAG: radical SAM protein, partial [Desulfitobacterium sp.]|nr:radical SAM protein [Desulfitobacterium sp.]